MNGASHEAIFVNVQSYRAEVDSREVIVAFGSHNCLRCIVDVWGAVCELVTYEDFVNKVYLVFEQ